MAPTQKECCTGLRAALKPDLFKALCDPTRLEILCQLASRAEPRNVGDIADQMPVDISVVSRHLGILKRAGVISSSRKGKEVYYALSSDDAVRTLRAVADSIEACCPTSKAA